MYSACLFCRTPLGANDVVEFFPVGRRLAFDAARGRLWVVCRSCERWCLSPLEERYEAIEKCEQLFRDTRLRAFTGQIGLARLPEGLELVRIGEPDRPEMAAWRYGDQFGRRRVRNLTRLGLGFGGIGAGIAAAVAGSFTLGAGGLIAGICAFEGMVAIGPDLARRILHGASGQVLTRIPGPDGRAWWVRREDALGLRLHALEQAAGWEVELFLNYRSFRFTGAEALRIVGRLLPAINRSGGSVPQVRSAVEFLDQAGSPDAAFMQAARRATSARRTHVQRLPYPVRLALEMASHEDQERRALEGEMAQLEQAWREAEEIASIADHLIATPGVEAPLERLQSVRDEHGA